MKRNSESTTGDWLISAAKRHPEAFLVMAAGCALLLRGKGGDSTPRDEYDDFYDDEDLVDEFVPHRGQRDGIASAVRERVSDVAEAASDYAAEVGERVADAGERVYDTAASYASAASGYAQEGGRVVRRRAAKFGGQAQYAADRVLREQPLAIAVLGLAAGAAAAALLPTSEMEERALSPARGKLAEAANRTTDALKDAASDMGREIKANIADRVLSGDVAKEAAKAFASSLTGESKGGASSGSPQ